MAETIQYKCPCCGGRLEFDSGLQKMKCPYCDTTFDVETLEGYDDALKQDARGRHALGRSAAAVGRRADGRLHLQELRRRAGVRREHRRDGLPVLRQSHRADRRLSGDLKPDYVIPFKLDKKAAEAALRNHMKGKRLLPNLFRSENRISEVKGVYVPFWLFDADADAHIRYHATRIRHLERPRL